jgi:hypothetical protein
MQRKKELLKSVLYLIQNPKAKNVFHILGAYMNRYSQAALFILLGFTLSYKTLADERKTSLTIYSTANSNNITPELYHPISGNQEENTAIPGYAIVYEQRHIDLKQGKNVIPFPNFSANIDPTTVMFKSLTDPKGTRVVEQNYNFELINKKELLERNLGQNISVEQNHGDQITTFNGKLLNATDSLVLQDKDGHTTSIQDYSVLRFTDSSNSIIIKPSLVWDIHAHKTASHLVETSYQTRGITWWADYNAFYEAGKDANHGFITLNAWVSILNKSGITYENTNLKLVAGNINKIQS